MALRHTARGIIVHDDKLLLIERWRDGLHYFSVPGGGIEAGETAEEACLREIAEETGCVVTLDRQLYMLTLPEGTQHHIFLCKYVSGTPHLSADSPEALQRDPTNRFVPGFIPLKQLATSNFMVWEPIRKRLLHDVTYGFEKTVAKLTPDMVP